jgi:hypothetical protein
MTETQAEDDEREREPERPRVEPHERRDPTPEDDAVELGYTCVRAPRF